MSTNHSPCRSAWPAQCWRQARRRSACLSAVEQWGKQTPDRWKRSREQRPSFPPSFFLARRPRQHLFLASSVCRVGIAHTADSSAAPCLAQLCFDPGATNAILIPLSHLSPPAAQIVPPVMVFVARRVENGSGHKGAQGARGGGEAFDGAFASGRPRGCPEIKRRRGRGRTRRVAWEAAVGV